MMTLKEVIKRLTDIASTYGEEIQVVFDDSDYGESDIKAIRVERREVHGTDAFERLVIIEADN
jgi:hypothetical protein